MSWTTLSIKDSGGTARTMRVWDEGGVGTGPFQFAQTAVKGDIDASNWNYSAATTGILNTTVAVTIKAAAGGGIRNYVTSISIMSEALTTATELAIRDGAGGTVIWRTKISVGGLPTTLIEFLSPLKSSANTLLEVVTLTASGAGAVYFNAQGFVAA